MPRAVKLLADRVADVPYLRACLDEPVVEGELALLSSSKLLPEPVSDVPYLIDSLLGAEEEAVSVLEVVAEVLYLLELLVLAGVTEEEAYLLELPLVLLFDPPAVEGESYLLR